MSREAEQHVIGSILVNNNIFDEVDFLNKDDFLNSEHQAIFSASKELIEKGKEVDCFIIQDNLKNLDLRYLVELSKNVPTTVNAKAYAKIVKRDSTNRKLMAAGNSIYQIAETDKPTEEKLDTALDLLSNLSTENNEKSKPVEINKFLSSTIDDIEKAYNNKGEIIGLSTGLIGLDEKTLGLHPSNLIIIAGRPSMGKTSLALNMAEDAAKKGKTALVFSMEMSGKELTQRELANLGSIPFNFIRSGKLNDKHWPRLTEATKQLNEMPLIIDETPALTIGELRLRAKQVQREKGLDLIVVDYIQLMSGSGDTRNETVSDISRGLKALAKELSVPVVALSQLNRSLEQRPNKRPIMSDLRDSGAIEQDADVILFVYRDEVYNEESPHKDIAEIIIGKQRQGALGTVFTKFIGCLLRFENYVGDIPQFSAPTRTKSFRG